MLFFICSFASLGEAKIRLRKVKDEPKTCTKMKVDEFLSRPEKKIFGTLKNSVVIEDDIVVVGDLGKKLCSWSLDQFSEKLNINSPSQSNENPDHSWTGQVQFYIDEYKNVLVPFIKKDQGYKQAIISLSTCDFEKTSYTEEPQFPKCDPPKKSSKKKKKKSS